MTFEEYQRKAKSFAIYKKSLAVIYPALGLGNEAGEVQGKVKKILRDGTFDQQAIAAELGDVLWYLSVLASDIGVSLEDIAGDNIEKLTSRKERGVIQGSGDTR